MLAKPFNFQDPRGWWMSEKLDGVRAIWTGSEFVSRNGNTFKVAAELVAQMPSGIVLDGEIYGGRGQFQKTMGAVRRGDWSGLEFVVFDAVMDGSFEDRLAAARRAQLPPWCRVLEHRLCSGDADLDLFMGEILSLGGEGVMLRKAGSAYDHKRSANLLKLKADDDAEGIVVGLLDGKGKHVGRVGALLVEAFGATFKIGTGLDDELRETPPAIGALVTFRFLGLTDAGVPRSPSFIAVRDYECAA